MFNSKYLKYKKKYIKLNIKKQYAGGLSGIKKKDYIKLLHRLYKPYEGDDTYYSDILKRLLEIAYIESKSVVDLYLSEIDKLTIPNIEKIKNVIDKQYKKIKSNTKTIIFDNSDYILDIPEFNIRSFQIVILYTFLIKLTHPNKEETSMLNYFQQPNYKIHKEFEMLLPIWTDYEKLLNTVKQTKFYSLIYYYKGYDQYMGYPPQPDYSFRNIKNARLICYLDYISEKEMVYSFINNIYYIGINEKLDYADSKLLTPFEFLHHDLTHANNRGDNIDFELEIKFYNFLEQISHLLSKEKKKQIYMIFFIITHESMVESILQEPIRENFTFNDLSPIFIRDLELWKNEHHYKLLLPKNIQAETDGNIQKYLNASFELFKNTWNGFYNIIIQEY